MARIAITALLVLGFACTTRTSSEPPPETAGDSSMDSSRNDAGEQPDTGTSMMSEPEPMPMDAGAIVVLPGMHDASVPWPVSDAGAAQDVAPSTDSGQTGERIELNDLAIFFTPTGSLRVGAWGYDASRGLCVSVIWYIDSISETRFCTPRLDLLQPYVLIEPMDDPGPTTDPKWDTQPAPCWDYGTAIELHAQRGCADFGELSDTADDHIDVELDVTSDAFSGTLSFGY